MTTTRLNVQEMHVYHSTVLYWLLAFVQLLSTRKLCFASRAACEGR